MLITTAQHGHAAAACPATPITQAITPSNANSDLPGYQYRYYGACDDKKH
jgi:hypothetical protein